MSAIHRTTIALGALFALGLASISNTVTAGPHPNRPGWGPRPPMQRPVHPPLHHSSWHNGWYWGPLAAGATLWGLSEIINSQKSQSNVQAPIQVIVPNQSQVQQPTTVYWCESEKGFFPQIRSCPTGWTALPATAVPTN